VTAHGLSHSFTTTAVEACDIPLQPVEHALGHASPVTAERYLHDERHTATVNAAVTDHLLTDTADSGEALVEPAHPTANLLNRRSARPSTCSSVAHRWTFAAGPTINRNDAPGGVSESRPQPSFRHTGLAHRCGDVPTAQVALTAALTQALA